MTKIKVGIVIGRFAPLHLGHQALIDAAVTASDKVVVLIGSACHYPDARTPFTFAERVKMLNEYNEDLLIQPLRDFKVGVDADQRWENEVFCRVGDALDITEENESDYDFTLFGNTKDDTDYLKWFPEWNYVEAGSDYDIDATSIRTHLYEYVGFHSSKVNPLVGDFLVEWLTSDSFKRIAAQYQAHIDYNEMWATTPYPVNFVAGDALVIGIEDEQAKILLIQRGCGAWAMAGGFLDKTETISSCIVRELQEETGLVVPESAIVKTTVIDNPTRSQRGRIITHCGLIYLEGCDTVEAGDDAVDARWFTLNEMDDLYIKGLMYSDHYDIIETVLVTQ